MATVLRIGRALVHNPIRLKAKENFRSKVFCYSQRFFQNRGTQGFYSLPLCTNRTQENQRLTEAVKTRSFSSLDNSKYKNVAIIGSSGAIGNTFTELLSDLYPNVQIHAFSRHHTKKISPNVFYHSMDYKDEASIEESALISSKHAPLDMVIVATGILHDGKLMPEKSIQELSTEKFQHLFEVNAIFPALVAKHFLPKLNRNNRAIFAALSARIGSISDNQLGGWYAYRASKAALNMIIKNLAIETGRSNKQAVIVGLHPGTVDSSLSKPFQGNVPDGKLFTPQFSVQKMLEVLDNLTPEQSGKCFAWDGLEIEP